MEINLVDLNLKAAIAFSLVLIAGLLTYIAFKDPIEKRRSSKASKTSH